MSKKFNIREWVLSVKYWSLLFIPHISIFLIFIIYALVGASIIQEIESDDSQHTSSSILDTTSPATTLVKPLDRERERLLSKIIDKRQANDVQQYIKYINKHIREYEDEIRKTFKTTINTEKTANEEKLRWTFAGSLYFIGTTLTTIGSNDFIPKTKIGKLFLMIYVAIGIPLTLVFLADLSLLITRLIKYLSLLLFRTYSTHYFLNIRQWIFFRFIEKQLDITIATTQNEDDLYSTKISQSAKQSLENYLDEDIEPKNRLSLTQKRLSQHIPMKHIESIYNCLIDALKDVNDDIDLTMPQLLMTLFIYIIIGACLIRSNSFFDSIYVCFTSIFTINLTNYYRNITVNHENNMKYLFVLSFYLLFGVAIVSLCIKHVQSRIQTSLENIGKKLLRDLVEFLRQMGFHELSTDDILAATDANTSQTTKPESNLLPPKRFTRGLSVGIDSSSLLTNRPIGIAEPVRRLSTGVIIRAYTKSDDDTNTDKSVQVNTIIRACGRCAGSTPAPVTSTLSVRKHSTVSISPSLTGELSSGCEDNDQSSHLLQTPNLDRLRQRRATLVAKTIINQMATQPAPLANEEPVPLLTLKTAQRHRSADTPVPVAYKLAPKSNNPTSDSEPKRGVNQKEFLEISKQISSLLVPSDDEN